MLDSLYRGHRFPREIISECVWLYFRFGVSFRDVEELMATRGVLVSYETVRCWCDKFGKQYADGLRRRRARSGDKWHLVARRREFVSTGEFSGGRRSIST